MRVVIPGGTGQVGRILSRTLAAQDHDVVVLTRSPRIAGQVGWDGSTLGGWARHVDGSDVVINLAGRSVSCRYTDENLAATMNSRVQSTEVVGEAIARAKRPPKVWLQMSTATIYAHRFDAANTERDGVIGGDEEGVPAYWAYSVKIARNWEAAQERAATPETRKVTMRSAMVMSPDHGGAVNLAAPQPLPQLELMRELRSAWRMPVGLPATRWMAEIGALAIRSDTELLLKSRRVVPGRLVDAGFTFGCPDWHTAAVDLVSRRRRS